MIYSSGRQAQARGRKILALANNKIQKINCLCMNNFGRCNPIGIRCNPIGINTNSSSYIYSDIIDAP